MLIKKNWIKNIIKLIKNIIIKKNWIKIKCPKNKDNKRFYFYSADLLKSKIPKIGV